MTYPADLKYTKDHEWVRIEGETATIGITEFAQSELGEVVFVELPEEGHSFSQGEEFCVIESTKAASDVYAPIGGTVKEVNAALEAEPQLVNTSSQEEGWLVKVANVDSKDLESLLSNEEYEAFIAEQ